MGRLAGLLLALCALVAGCVTPIAGVPGPSSAATSSSAQPPPRPREVRVDGVDPCSLLTEQERRDLGLDQEPVPTTLPSALYNGGVVQLCSVGGFEPRAYSVGILLSVTGGIELYRRPGVPSEIRPIDVGGFPAVLAVPTIDRFCAVIVDVAPGQALDVTASDGGRLPPIPQADLCVEAQRTASAALGNLLTRS